MWLLSKESFFIIISDIFICFVYSLVKRTPFKEIENACGTNIPIPKTLLLKKVFLLKLSLYVHINLFLITMINSLIKDNQTKTRSNLSQQKYIYIFLLEMTFLPSLQNGIVCF